MKHPTLLGMPLSVSFINVIFVFIISTPASHGAEDNQNYTTCEKPYECGRIKGIRYPFWGDGRPPLCGVEGFNLTCHPNEEYPTIVMGDWKFHVLAINESVGSMTIARTDMSEDICHVPFPDTTLNFTLVDYSPYPHDVNISLFYDCHSGLPPDHELEHNYFTCPGVEGINLFLPELYPSVPQCESSVKVTVSGEAVHAFMSNQSTSVEELVNKGFGVEYHEMEHFQECQTCSDSGGMCGTDTTTHEPICFCRDGPQFFQCPKGINWRKTLGIGIGAVAGTLLVVAVVCITIKHRRNKKYNNTTSSWISRITSSYTSSSKTDIEKEASFFGVQTFSYDELQKATNNFDTKKEVGDGGFGTVYKGKLRDGRVVAVKRLYEHNFKRVEQFMNEVEILTRLRHQNLVSLYGCTSRHCRELLLVYEYIPNGTVADHLHGERAKPGSLSWTTRMSIALETAEALAYLHTSDVIHRDVKTNNILLDNNFCVKVADFGLSRLFPIDVTHVSTAPQGTPGYVDPEYHKCYQLTSKSDVYSFGVVLIELISSKPAVDITRHRHEINLSNMAINMIQNHELHELVDPCLGFESDYKVRGMITMVAELAFRCLQNERDMRPSMEEMLEVLKEIRNQGYSTKIAEEVDIPADDVVLLKSDPPTLSPNSLMENWISKGSTTSNASS